MSPREVALDALMNPAEYPAPGESLWVWVVGQRIAGFHVGDGSEVSGWRRVEWEGPWLNTAVSRAQLAAAIERALLPSDEAALRVACPECAAAPGVACDRGTRHGNAAAKGPHARRVQGARP